MKASNKISRTGELNLTPLIDCVVILVSFLLLVTEFSRENEFPDITLPNVEQAIEIRNPDPSRLVIMIKETGDCYVSGGRVTEEELARVIEVEARLAHERGGKLSNCPVVLGADERTPWQHIQKIMGICTNGNVRIWRLAFATKPSPLGDEAVPRKAGT